MKANGNQNKKDGAAQELKNLVLHGLCDLIHGRICAITVYLLVTQCRDAFRWMKQIKWSKNAGALLTWCHNYDSSWYMKNNIQIFWFF